MMTTIDLNEILNQIKEEIKIAPLGNLPKGKTMDSLVGHTVISLSDITPIQGSSASPRKKH